jgi:hypothetical protein
VEGGNLNSLKATMTDATLAPLVEADVDLRDFGFMPLEVVRLRDSELAVVAPPEVFRASVLLWAASWHQVPAASLPAKDSLLADLAKSVKAWPRIRSAVMAEWVLCSDGRLYHPVVAEKAREAWEAKQARIARTAKATAARLGKRGSGTSPPSDDPPPAPRDDAPHEERDEAADEERDVARNVHQGKGREGKGEKEKGGARSYAQAVARAPDDGDTRDSEGGLSEPKAWPDRMPPAARPAEHQPTRAGAACLAMRRTGLAAVNPGDPRLLALLAQGVTDDELAGMAAEAVSKGKGWAWVLAGVQGRRAEAAAIHLAPKPAATVHSTSADTTAAYLREQQLTPEQREKAAEARAAFLAKHNRRAAA